MFEPVGRVAKLAAWLTRQPAWAFAALAGGLAGGAALAAALTPTGSAGLVAWAAGIVLAGSGAGLFVLRRMSRCVVELQRRVGLLLAEAGAASSSGGTGFPACVAQAGKPVLPGAPDEQLLLRLGEWVCRQLPEGSRDARMVSEFADALAQRLDVPPAQRPPLLAAAALLHDLGLHDLPAGLIDQPGPLTSEQRRQMQQHPVAGAARLAGIDSPGAAVMREVCLHHHERFDGRGYPMGLVGRQIPLAARIVALADAFQAMLSPRPHRRAMPFHQAVEIVRSESGGQFDPDLVDAFERALNDLVAAKLRIENDRERERTANSERQSRPNAVADR